MIVLGRNIGSTVTAAYTGRTFSEGDFFSGTEATKEVRYIQSFEWKFRRAPRTIEEVRPLPSDRVATACLLVPSIHLFFDDKKPSGVLEEWEESVLFAVFHLTRSTGKTRMEDGGESAYCANLLLWWCPAILLSPEPLIWRCPIDGAPRIYCRPLEHTGNRR